MKLRIISAMVATVSVCLFPAPTMWAAPLHNPNQAGPTMSQPAKVHRIAFQLRNETGQAMTVQMGEQARELSSGQTLKLKLPEGQSLTAVSPTPHHAAGDVLAVVSMSLDGNVLVLH